jgi:hypothetical protein
MSRLMSQVVENLATVAAPERAQPSDGTSIEAGETHRAAHARASEIVAEIAVDAAAHPDVYLRDTAVPEGGE